MNQVNTQKLFIKCISFSVGFSFMRFVNDLCFQTTPVLVNVLKLPYIIFILIMNKTSQNKKESQANLSFIESEEPRYGKTGSSMWQLRKQYLSGGVQYFLGARNISINHWIIHIGNICYLWLVWVWNILHGFSIR